jgi:hypothetical protein
MKDRKFEHRWLDDVKRMQSVLIGHGHLVSLQECADIWDEYSYSFAAGWMCLPSDDLDLYNILISYDKL